MSKLIQYTCGYLLLAFVIAALWTVIFAHALPPVCSFQHVSDGQNISYLCE